MMATTTGDIASPQLPFGERNDSKHDMKQFIKEINKINDERLKRYNDLIGKPVIAGKERNGVVKRVIPKN